MTSTNKNTPLPSIREHAEAWTPSSEDKVDKLVNPVIETLTLKLKATLSLTGTNDSSHAAIMNLTACIVCIDSFIHEVFQNTNMDLRLNGGGGALVQTAFAKVEFVDNKAYKDYISYCAKFFTQYTSTLTSMLIGFANELGAHMVCFAKHTFESDPTKFRNTCKQVKNSLTWLETTTEGHTTPGELAMLLPCVTWDMIRVIDNTVKCCGAEESPPFVERMCMAHTYYRLRDNNVWYASDYKKDVDRLTKCADKRVATDTSEPMDINRDDLVSRKRPRALARAPAKVLQAQVVNTTAQVVNTTAGQELTDFASMSFQEICGKIRTLEKENATLDHTNDFLTRRSDEAAKEIEQLKEDMAYNVTELESCQEQLGGHYTWALKEKETAEKIHGLYKMLQSECGDMKAEIEAQKAANIEATDAVEKQQEAIETQKAVIEARNAVIEAQKAAIKDQETKILAQKTKIKAQKAEIEAQKAEIEAQKAEIKTQKTAKAKSKTNTPEAPPGAKAVIKPENISCRSPRAGKGFNKHNA